MSDFNMVNNGRFARNSTNGVNDWNHVNLVASDTTVTDSERGSCLRITGEPDKEKRVLQGIYAKGGEGDVFRFGCFAKAEAIPGKTFRIAAAVIYADGTISGKMWILIHIEAAGSMFPVWYQRMMRTL